MVEPGDAEAFHFCGHTYTTDSCPHPTGMPRIDRKGFPLRAKDGHPIDDLGRLIDADGRAVDEDGRLLTDPDGRPLPIASRTRDLRRRRRPLSASTPRSTAPGSAAAAARCASSSTAAPTAPKRINGDASLTGYCYKGRRVFCVMYFDTKVKC